MKRATFVTLVSDAATCQFRRRRYSRNSKFVWPQPLGCRPRFPFNRMLRAVENTSVFCAERPNGKKTGSFAAATVDGIAGNPYIYPFVDFSHPLVAIGHLASFSGVSPGCVDG